MTTRRDHPAPRRRRDAGFSLVELTLTAAIIGLVAALAAPRYAASLQHAKLQAAARRVVADLQHARQTAQATSDEVSLQFDTSRHQISSEDLARLNAPGRDYLTDLAAEPFGVRIASANFAGEDECEFDGFGTPASDGTITLELGGSTVVITLSAETGQAVIQ